MTAFQLIAPLPLITLDAGCLITVEAIDPDTGTAVTGVTVSAVTIYATSATATFEPLEEQDSFFIFAGDDA